MQTKHHRLLALLMTVVMAFQIFAIAPHTAFAEVTETGVISENEEHPLIAETNEVSGDDSPQLRATTGKTVLAFTSDIHNGTASGGETNTGSIRLSTWLSKVQPMYNNSIEVFGFCGDMASAGSNQSTFWTFTQTVMTNIDDHGLTGVYAVGNHEYMNGQMASTSSSPEVRAKYRLNEEGRAVDDENYVIYCLGTNSSHGTSWAYDDSQITTLTNYLNSVDNDKVIIILTHFPLHDYGSHRTGNTLPVLNAVNAAAVGADGTYGTADDKKIVFLWGHNHSEGDNNYDQVWLPGEQINNSDKSTVYFYYAAAGCMADGEYGQSAKILGKGLVLEIDAQNKLAFSYYDANGNNVTEPDRQTITEQDPVEINGVTISAESTTVLAGAKIQLSYTTDPLDATTKTVAWTSDDTSVATVDNKGLVKTKSEGTVTITVTISDGITRNTVSDSVEITVLHNDNPSVEETINITPSTSNPSESIEINVGDTLVINVTNGSSNSAYDFTATLSKSGVAEVQGSSTVNIAAGGTGQIVLEGIADGTVDITIQNNSSYGASYARKGTIHLTVGDGATPVDPPTGDTVDITPTTSNPAVSATINVDDTLTINVTNSSTRSAYDFTLTFSKSGVAEAQGSATVNIPANGTGQFTVKGIADGKVDITISNNNSSSERKGIVHLTVGEGGSSVDPPTGDTVSITPTTDNPEESATINVGESLVITVTNSSTNSAYDFTATLSNTGIAQINGNSTVNIAQGGTGQFTVTGLAAGSVDITIQNENSYGSQYTRKGIVHLTVNEAVDIPVTGISLNKSTLRLSAGESETLTATLTPANTSHKDVTWSSNNADVATVSNGVVTAKATGTAIITAKSVDGPSATCSVTVTAVETVTYTLTDKFEDGKEYIIASGNSGSVYVISDTSTGSGTSTGLVGISATAVNESITLTAADAAKAVFTAEIKASSQSDTTSVWLKHGSNYLYTASSGGLRISNEQTTNSGSTDNTGKFWHYKADGKDLLWYFKDTNTSDGYTNTGSTYRYYLNCSNTGTFTSKHVGENQSLSGTDTPKIYIFEKSEQQSASGECTIAVTASKNEVLPGETVTFTVTLLGPVSNFGSMNMELDIPAGLSYVTGTGKLADNLRQTLGFDEALDDGMGVFFDENTLMISGCGTKNYSSQDDTVLATFDCTVDENFSGPATVTLKEELEVGDVENWVLLEASAIGADITLHVHEWEVTWNWTGSDASGYTAAVATIACQKDPTHTQTVTATVETSTPSSGEDAGYTVYTATVTAANSPDGTAHTDKKRVPITYTISYDLDGGIVATANPVAYTVESDPITLNNPTKTGCTFLGWTGTGLSSATTAVTIAKGSTGDRSYTATWRVDGYEISGNITSYIGKNDIVEGYTYTEGPVAVVLYASGTDTVVKEAAVSDDNKTYTLTGVANGTYDLKVTKKDHAPRTYEITVSDGAVTLDVEIRLYGDLNGDGKLTTADVGRINSHAVGVRPLTGYDLVVADVLGPDGGPDGNVTTADAGRANSHAVGVRLLW